MFEFLNKMRVLVIKSKSKNSATLEVETDTLHTTEVQMFNRVHINNIEDKLSLVQDLIPELEFITYRGQVRAKTKYGLMKVRMVYPQQRKDHLYWTVGRNTNGTRLGELAVLLTPDSNLKAAFSTRRDLISKGCVRVNMERAELLQKCTAGAIKNLK